jgi:uncharacterized protein YkwD
MNLKRATAVTNAMTIARKQAKAAVPDAAKSRIMGAVRTRGISMHFASSILRIALLAVGLAIDQRLTLPASGQIDLQQAMAKATYPMVSVQAISLAGPSDPQAAMKAIKESFCQVVLDPQFIDVGVSHEGRDWRIVLARPLLAGKLGDTKAEGQKLLGLINAARAQARQCGAQPYAAAPPLSWNTVLEAASLDHSRDMANNNYFDHKDRSGGTPGDRAELAGYLAQELGENIAAGQDSARKVVDGWLASPGHCANLMNPAVRDLGAAYATDPKSNAGIYWTAMFGAAQ